MIRNILNKNIAGRHLDDKEMTKWAYMSFLSMPDQEIGRFPVNRGEFWELVDTLQSMYSPVHGDLEVWSNLIGQEGCIQQLDPWPAMVAVTTQFVGSSWLTFLGDIVIRGQHGTENYCRCCWGWSLPITNHSESVSTMNHEALLSSMYQFFLNIIIHCESSLTGINCH